MTAHVLCVDDVPANLRLLEANLQGEYYRVSLATSGEEALALALRDPPDIVLLDVMMPGLDGFATCRRFKEIPATEHIPIVMVTALSDPDDRVRGLECGADDFISKPVDAVTLFARLKALLRTKQVLDAWRLRVDTARALGLDPPARPPARLDGARALLLHESLSETAPIASALALDGMGLKHVVDGQAARMAIAHDGCDLVLLSLSLPGGEALRFASGLRAEAETRDMPLLMLADADQRDLMLRAFDLGVNDHLLRPLDGNELRARVRNQLRRMRYQTQLREDFDRSLEMAVTDTVTGLRNRRFALRHLEGRLLAGGPVAVVMADVDRFKSINDRFGHNIGDAALREVATRMQANMRGSDLLARHGGEEFIVILGATTPDDAIAVADRLRCAIAESMMALGAESVTVTASFGVAIGHSGIAPHTLIGAADAALYRAKENGRNRVEFAKAEDWAIAVRSVATPA